MSKARPENDNVLGKLLRILRINDRILPFKMNSVKNWEHWKRY